jgi:hypothetical protein
VINRSTARCTCSWAFFWGWEIHCQSSLQDFAHKAQPLALDAAPCVLESVLESSRR